MDIATSLTLLNLFTFNIPLNPTVGEMENRFESENKLKEDLFKDYDGSVPGATPVRVIPILHVDHVRSVDELQGALTISATFTFVWMDTRLKWNFTNYGGLRALAGEKGEFVLQDVWMPCLHLTDLPGATKQSDLFLNHDVELFISYTGTVRATIKVIITTPCYFGFGDYPNDYQNCSLTLMSPSYADELQFSLWGGVEIANYLLEEKDIADVQDFELLDIETQGYYMYLGLKIVEDLAQYKMSHCRAYFRFNMMLKRLNKLIFAQLSAPMIAICMFIGVSGVVPNTYGLTILIFSVGFQLMNAINMAEVLPDDFNGMPTLGVLAMFMMFETLFLIGWRLFSMYVRSNKLFRCNAGDDPTEQDIKNSVVQDIVIATDGVLMVMLMCQCVGNIYIVLNN